jgi:succinate-acetate transporter protein
MNDSNNDINKDKLFDTLEKIQSHVFHIKSENQLSDSIIDYFTMAIGLFMYGIIHADIIVNDNNKQLLYYYIAFAGFAQIGLGIYDWYKGKTLTLLVNFLFGFLFISWFFKFYYIINPEGGEVNEDEFYEGAFYILWFALSASLIVGVKNKGILYSLDYLVIAVAFVFLFVDKYANQKWLKKAYGYSFLVSGCLFWITGLLRFINSTLAQHALGIVKE